ncbi:flagellar export chaperone FliS [Thiomicrospira aerophila]|nr:flagellar export chaperone FliS [Thiomicrospira aerophila]
MQKQAQQYQNHFLETSVSEATPYKLVALLYENGIKHMKLMRLMIERKQIAAKTEQANRVTSILYGLKAGLDMELGGDVAANLDALYNYIIKQVLTASLNNDLVVLDEALGLLQDLQEAWSLMPESYQRLTAAEIKARQQVK